MLYILYIYFSTFFVSISSIFDSCISILSYLRFPDDCQSLISSSLDTSLLLLHTLIYFFLVFFTSYGLFFHIEILRINISLFSIFCISKSKITSGNILFLDILDICSSNFLISSIHTIFQLSSIPNNIIPHSALRKLTISAAIESILFIFNLNSDLLFSHFAIEFKIFIMFLLITT